MNNEVIEMGTTCYSICYRIFAQNCTRIISVTSIELYGFTLVCKDIFLWIYPRVLPNTLASLVYVKGL